jgi:sarcosine oxidase
VVRVAVVGAGVVGLAAAQQLLLHGVEVDCYEAEAPMAGRSLGDTRIFRLLHADPELAALAMQAKEGWQEWSAMADKTLVGSEGVLVSGQPAYAWHQATEAAGASVQFSDGLPASCEVPAHRPVGPFAYDAAGGVIDVKSTGAFLIRELGHRLIAEPVVAIETIGEHARIVTAQRATSYDAVVVAAGAGTPKLAADAGLRLPDRLERPRTVHLPARSSNHAAVLDRTQRDMEIGVHVVQSAHQPDHLGHRCGPARRRRGMGAGGG